MNTINPLPCYERERRGKGCGAAVMVAATVLAVTAMISGTVYAVARAEKRVVIVWGGAK